MGDRAKAQICFGIAFEEDHEFPWDNYECIDDWWVYEVLKFKPTVQIYNDEGNWINGIEPDKKLVDDYYNEKSFVKNSRLIPIELVRHSHYANPMYIIALPGYTIEVDWGELEIINPESFCYDIIEKRVLIDFCKEFNIKFKEDPKWYLTVYYG